MTHSRLDFCELARQPKWLRRVRMAWLALRGGVSVGGKELSLDQAYYIMVPGKGLYVGTLDWFVGPKAEEAMKKRQEQD